MQRHDPIKNQDAWRSSIREFSKLFYPKIMGGTDIDFLYERNGKFLIIEGKQIIDNVLKISFGQYRALANFKLLSPANVKVLLVGENEKGYYVFEVTDRYIAGYNKLDQRYYLDVTTWQFFSRESFVDYVATICKSYEQKFT